MNPIPKLLLWTALALSGFSYSNELSPQISSNTPQQTKSVEEETDRTLARRIREEVKSADCRRIAQNCAALVRDRLERGKLTNDHMDCALTDKDLLLASHVARYFSQPKVQVPCAALKDSKFVEWLFSHPEIFEELAFSYAGGRKTIGVLRSIWVKENCQLEGVLLNLAVGAALNGDEYPEEELLAKYDFYKQSYTDKALFIQFETLKPWEMAIVLKTINNIGKIEDFTWAQSHLAARPKIQADNTGDAACGLIPYRDKNKDGVSIHSGAFYDNKPASLKLFTEYGGVCGTVSHGASGFCRVKGIPSYPVGQPGHCAFIWKKPGNHWVIGNNVCGGWNWSQGGSDMIPWKGATACIQSMDHYLSMDKASESTNAYYFSTLMQKGDVRDRLVTYALTLNRKNYPAWQARLNGLKQKQGMRPEEILAIAKELNASFTEEPAVLEYLINSHLSPHTKFFTPFQLSSFMLDRIESGESRDVYLRNLWKQALKDIPELKGMNITYDHTTSSGLLGKWTEFYRKDRKVSSRAKMKTSLFLQKTIASLTEHRKTRSEMIEFYLNFLMDWKDDRQIASAADFVEKNIKEIKNKDCLKDMLNFGLKLAMLQKSKAIEKKYQEKLDNLATA